MEHLILRLTLHYSDYSTQQIKYKEREIQKIEDHPVQNLALEKNPLLQERFAIIDQIIKSKLTLSSQEFKTLALTGDSKSSCYDF